MIQAARWLAVLALAACPWALAAAGEGEVFVVSDVYGLSPEGKVQELKNGDFGKLKLKNGHWDAASKTIRMYAAKNEEVAVQIVIPRKGKAFCGRMSELKGPGVIPADRASFGLMCWTNLQSEAKAGKPSSALAPDLVVPLDGSIAGLKSFDVPLTVKGLPNPGNSVGKMLFEVWVPKEAAPGTYSGTVEILDGEAAVAKLNLHLEVFDFALPDMPTFAFDLLSYGMPSENFKLGGYLNESGLGKPAKAMPAEGLRFNHQTYKLAMDNRCFVNVLPYSSQRGSPRFALPVQGKGESATIMSYQEWDDLFGPILDGKCNKFGAPPAHFTLCFNVNYPHVCESDEKKQFNWMPYAKSMPEGPGKNLKFKEFEDTNKAIAAQYVAHFAEKGWTKTRFEIYHNQKAQSDRNRVPWKLDEPCAGPDYQALRYFFNVAKWSFESAAAKNIQVVTRIDIGHFHCDQMQTPDGKTAKCYKGKGYDKDGAQGILKDCTDHWVVGVTHSEGAFHKVKEYEHPGMKFIIYGTPKRGLLRHHTEFAGESYKCARMGATGRVIYKLDPLDPNGWSGASAMYHARSMGADATLAPQRLKLWRNAVNDYEYIHEARKKDSSAAEEIVLAMTKIGPSADESYRTKSQSRGVWLNNNVEDLLTAKRLLAAIVSGKPAPQDVKLAGFSEEFSACGSADEIVGYD